MAINKANKFVTSAAAGLAALGSLFGAAHDVAAQDATVQNVAITTPEIQQTTPVTAKEAFGRSKGQIVFMDAGNLLRADIKSIKYSLDQIKAVTGLSFEIIPVIAESSKNQSFMCFNANGCYPVAEDTITTALSTVEEFAVKHGLKPNKHLASLEFEQ